MEKKITADWYMVLIKGIIMIALAVLLLSSPVGAVVAFSLYIGIGFLLTGILVIYRSFLLKKAGVNWSWTMFEGFLDLFLGYMIMANPLVTAKVLPFVIGFWAVFYGIFLVINAFSGKSDRLMKIVAGILIIIIGNLIMHNPLFIGMTFAIWVGIMLLIAGIYNVIASFSLK
ncbi:MAG: hypothetical protein DRJ15_17125 [Bacteroidetes bacterium]|nr:MAG: hypothetical protein DRI83_11675 [Bacteroidota bacterium]RLD75364.1 MAG: hypothetical protein DRJ15_17125 [Bacteroidota bacterium]